MSRILLLVTTLLVVSAVPPSALADQRDRTGFFTNLHYNEEGGDLLGYELYVALTRDGYTGALYECQGGCFPVRVIEPRFDGDAITFEYTDMEGDTLIFNGAVGPSGITGSFTLPGVGPLETLRLERKPSYWN